MLVKKEKELRCLREKMKREEERAAEFSERCINLLGMLIKSSQAEKNYAEKIEKGERDIKEVEEREEKLYKDNKVLMESLRKIEQKNRDLEVTISNMARKEQNKKRKITLHKESPEESVQQSLPPAIPTVQSKLPERQKVEGSPHNSLGEVCKLPEVSLPNQHGQQHPQSNEGTK